MTETPRKKPGPRPKDPSKKAIKPNISLRTDLIAEAETAAQRRGMGFSEYVAMCLQRQLGRDEEAAGKLTVVPPATLKKQISSRSTRA